VSTSLKNRQKRDVTPIEHTLLLYLQW